jgi:TolB protein
MNFKLFFFLFAFLGTLRGEEEIRVYLNTTSNLEPIYIANLQSPDNSFAESYLKELHKVLEFDFNHNGWHKVLAVTEQREKVAQGTVIKGEVKQKTLVCTLQAGSLKQFPALSLTGRLSEDRRQIHRLADAICKALHGQEGVASTGILYSVKNKHKDKWVSEIWSCDWDGVNARQVTREGSMCATPVFIPPHAHYANDRFLYVSYKMGQPKIFIANLKEGVGKRILDLHGNQLLPAISWQRDKIAFICDANHTTADLFLQEFHPEKGAVGKPVQLFSYPRSTQGSPTFSPDGTKLAFVSDKDGSPRIYLIPAQFTPKRPAPVLLTKRNQENSCPAWSPDGKKLAYSAKTKGTRQIWIFDFETGEEWQLTDGATNKENPSWAPNSRHLVFNSTDGHTSELYIVNLQQSEAVKISQGAGIKHYPTWGTTY